MNFSNFLQNNVDAKQLIPGLVACGVLSLIILIAEWRVFVKAGKHGWAVLIPFYNLWTEYKIICGRGTAMFRLLIPVYNIYWAIKSMIKMAHAFGKSNGFGVGLLFLNVIFVPILGFGNAKYLGPQDM